jgi:TetR/AcrR family transcriptional regulator, regulator of biofilm formation and stress response
VRNNRPSPARSRRRGRGPADIERRDRIAAAAVKLISEKGIHGFNFRAVAELAGVPLGSATYYFADREELLLAAIEHETADFAARVAQYLSPTQDNLVSQLGRLIVEMTATRAARSRTRVGYELYTAAMHSKRLRAASLKWDSVVRDAIAKRSSEREAQLLYTFLNGLALETLIRDIPLELGEVTDLLSEVISS